MALGIGDMIKELTKNGLIDWGTDRYQPPETPTLKNNTPETTSEERKTDWEKTLQDKAATTTGTVKTR